MFFGEKLAEGDILRTLIFFVMLYYGSKFVIEDVVGE